MAPGARAVHRAHPAPASDGSKRLIDPSSSVLEAYAPRRCPGTSSTSRRAARGPARCASSSTCSASWASRDRSESGAPGTRNPDHLRENLAAVEVQLTTPEIAELDAAFAELVVARWPHERAADEGRRVIPPRAPWPVLTDLERACSRSWRGGGPLSRPSRWTSRTPSEWIGAPGRTRTCDRPLRRRLLYPAELRALVRLGP